jgi:NADPH:quinone reductase-like Zn-dependent oxidoreductase
VVLHEAMALPIPGTLSFVEAAAIPEVFLTAFQALDWLANLQAGEKILIHAGASGVGTAAIQLAQEMGASDILVTASAGKHALCRELGAQVAIDYHTESFAAQTTAHTNGYGVDVIIDFIAAPYFQSNLDILATDGRLVLLALLGGTMPEGISLAPVLRKRLQITGSTLRSRDLAYKIRLSQALKAFAWQAFAEGRLRPVIDQVLPWTEIAAAHRRMEANQNAGKIVLEVR